VLGDIPAAQAGRATVAFQFPDEVTGGCHVLAFLPDHRVVWVDAEDGQHLIAHERPACGFAWSGCGRNIIPGTTRTGVGLSHGRSPLGELGDQSSMHSVQYVMRPGSSGSGTAR
jgi:hypothetical protein